MKKKEDRRVTMTKRLLKEALIEMLKETDIYQISIRELCEQADVNRSTFYKYYGNQFDLMADVENDHLRFFAESIEKYEGNSAKAFEMICSYMEEHAESVRVIVNNNIDAELPKKLLSMNIVYEAAGRKYGEQMSEDQKEYLYNFLTYGAFRIIYIWLNKEKREPAEEFAKTLARLLMP